MINEFEFTRTLGGYTLTVIRAVGSTASTIYCQTRSDEGRQGASVGAEKVLDRDEVDTHYSCPGNVAAADAWRASLAFCVYCGGPNALMPAKGWND